MYIPITYSICFLFHELGELLRTSSQLLSGPIGPICLGIFGFKGLNFVACVMLGEGVCWVNKKQIRKGNGSFNNPVIAIY